MAEHHHHDHTAGASERALRIALALTTGFLVVEVAGGLWTGSLALLSDAAHMFTDAAALAIALLATRMARKPADEQRTFGYHRFEILAAAFNALLLFAVALYILYEAVRRIQAPEHVASTGMLAIAVVGLLVNLASMRVLSGGQAHSLNMKGAYLEVWADMLGSLGVIAGALVIRLTGWTWVDSAVAVGIGLWVLPRTWSLLGDSVHVLLEGVPRGLVLADVRAGLLACGGVASQHDLHVWSLASGKVSLSAHLVLQRGADAQAVLGDVHRMLQQRFGIRHSTLQLETVACMEEGAVHSFGEDHDHDHDHAAPAAR